MHHFFNGKFLNEEAFQDLGIIEFDNISLFSTMRTSFGKLLDWDLHKTRLQDSLSFLALSDSIDWCHIESGLEQVIAKNYQGRDLRIKLQIRPDGCWFIKCAKLPLPPADLWEKGGKVDESSVLFRTPSQFKYAWDYYPKFFAEIVKSDNDYTEKLLFDRNGYLLEGVISNVFAVFGETLVTPKANILLGIGRQKIIDYARSQNVKIEERLIHRDELKKADEIFLVNAVRGVQPIGRWGSWKNIHFSAAKRMQVVFER